MEVSEIENKIRIFLEENGRKNYGRPNVHFCGLPSESLYGTILRRVDASKGISGYYDEFLITPTNVIRASLRAPYNYNDWSVHWIKGYSTKEELLSIVPETITAIQQTAW